MKALEILKNLKNEMQNNDGIINWDCSYEYFKKVDNAIKEIEDLQKEIQVITDDKRTLKDFVFTNCNECINKVDNHFTETCLSCTRYYGCYFEKKGNK